MRRISHELDIPLKDILGNIDDIEQFVHYCLSTHKTGMSISAHLLDLSQEQKDELQKYINDLFTRKEL